VRKSGKKVLLVAATNYYSRLDEALIRPGRLHQRVSVLPPQQEEEVIALLKYYLRGDLADADLTQLARIGRGATPAQVEGWLGQARGAARAAGHTLRLEDILEQMIPRDDRPARDIEAIALHEIGHAIVAHSLGHAVESVSILQQGMFGGVTATVVHTLVPTWHDIMDTVCIKLAGRAADIEIGRGANAGAGTDLASATQVLSSALAQYGLGDKLLHVPDTSLTSPALGDEIDALLKAQLRRAQQIVRAYAGVARWLAERLMHEKVLPGVTVSRALERSGTAKQSDSTVDRSRSGD
jgi:cell division protease FtsH